MHGFSNVKPENPDSPQNFWTSVVHSSVLLHVAEESSTARLLPQRAETDSAEESVRGDRSTGAEGVEQETASNTVRSTTKIKVCFIGITGKASPAVSETHGGNLLLLYRE